MERIVVAGMEAGASAELIGRTLARSGHPCTVSVLDGEERTPCALGVYTGGEGAKGPKFSQCQRLVLSLDDPWGRQLASRDPGHSFTYSERRDQADLTAKNLQLVRGRVEFEALTDEDIRRVRLPLASAHAFYPSLAALGCGLSLGIPLGVLVSSIEEVCRETSN